MNTTSVQDLDFRITKETIELNGVNIEKKFIQYFNMLPFNSNPKIEITDQHRTNANYFHKIVDFEKQIAETMQDKLIWEELELKINNDTKDILYLLDVYTLKSFKNKRALVVSYIEQFEKIKLYKVSDAQSIKKEIINIYNLVSSLISQENLAREQDKAGVTKLNQDVQSANDVIAKQNETIQRLTEQFAEQSKILTELQKKIDAADKKTVKQTEVNAQ